METLEARIGASVTLRSGETVVIRRLSVRQLLQIAKKARGALASVNADDVREAALHQDWIVLGQLLDEDLIGFILSALLVDRSADWCLDHLDIEDLADIIPVVAETGGWKKILQAFTSASANSPN